VVEPFGARHRSGGFDIIEGPEFNSDAAHVSAAFPELPLLVKLHAPRFTIDLSNAHYVSDTARARYFLGGLRRGRVPDNPWAYDPKADPERLHAAAADLVAANSVATASRVASAWQIPQEQMTVVPYSFSPSAELMSIPPDSMTNTVLFFGRLEVRKGVLELAKAIPLVLSVAPFVKFRFVGRSLPHPQDGRPLSDHIRRHAAKFADLVDICDAVPYDQIPKIIAGADICIFPSDWEAAGFVCMEAMAAARGVIGSSAGGMSELLEEGGTGLLIPPRSPRAIADAILDLVRSPERRMAMGRRAREHAAKAFSPEVIAPLQEASYAGAIARKRARLATSARA
jgi:glycosyltransferase involved in cell wall biosynthesis